jgi:hypothetical protein
MGPRRIGRILCVAGARPAKTLFFKKPRFFKSLSSSIIHRRASTQAASPEGWKLRRQLAVYF